MAERRFADGAAVRVRDLPVAGHMRTPFYVRGRQGWIEGLQGSFPNPEERAYGKPGLPPHALYHVRFRQQDLWPAYAGGKEDCLSLDLFEHWLEPVHGA
jgi:nitrile hydratase beta subunit-like protein